MFPGVMKKTEIAPVFIKLDNTSKDNYRLIITLSSLQRQRPSKVLVFVQLNNFMESSQNILQVSENVIIWSIPF